MNSQKKKDEETAPATMGTTTENPPPESYTTENPVTVNCHLLRIHRTGCAQSDAAVDMSWRSWSCLASRRFPAFPSLPSFSTPKNLIQPAPLNTSPERRSHHRTTKPRSNRSQFLLLLLHLSTYPTPKTPKKSLISTWLTHQFNNRISSSSSLLLSPTPRSSSISSLDGNNFRNPTTCAAKRSQRGRNHYLVGCVWIQDWRLLKTVESEVQWS